MAILQLVRCKNPTNLIAFKDLEFGEVFRYGGHVYIKTDLFTTDSEQWNCIRVEDEAVGRGLVQLDAMVQLADSAELKTVFSEL